MAQLDEGSDPGDYMVCDHRALRKYGPVRGSLKAAWRILRCNPWSHGGVDYP